MTRLAVRPRPAAPIAANECADIAACATAELGLPIAIAVTERAAGVEELSPAERRQLAALTTRERVRSWLRGRAALKALIGPFGDTDTTRIRFPSARYSLTHSGEVAVAAVARTERSRGVGIDLEWDRPAPVAAARFYLTELEAAWAACRPARARGRAAPAVDRQGGAVQGRSRQRTARAERLPAGGTCGVGRPVVGGPPHVAVHQLPPARRASHHRRRRRGSAMNTLSDNERWLLSFYRTSEISGALFFGRLARAMRPGPVQIDMTKHFADESQHAWYWTDCINRFGVTPYKLDASYQDQYVSACGIPANLMEVLAITQVFEKRVIHQYARHVRVPGLAAPIVATIEKIMGDERWHIEWVRGALKALEPDYGKADIEATKKRFGDADREVYAKTMKEHEERIGELFATAERRGDLAAG
jgi:hypothetical protein